ncbi:MAG TPA: PspA/IM30 family protein [Gammaproteobacteria bacterium]|nr:PspA/IM30 family protein [Gammaproteobacteria bacterium]
MALIERLARLFQADVHAVLDRMEEPETLLKHALREMEDELAACEQRMRRLRQEQEQLLQRQAGIEQSLLRIDEELDICFNSGNDELPRTLVKRKLETQLFLRAVAQRREALDKALREQQAVLEEGRGQFESMRQKAELMAAEAQAGVADTQSCTRATTEFRVQEADIEIALLRERQQRAGKAQTPPAAKGGKPS